MLTSPKKRYYCSCVKYLMLSHEMVLILETFIYFLQAVEIVEASVDHINCLIKELKHLFLVEDIVDSIKVLKREQSSNFHILIGYGKLVLEKASTSCALTSVWTQVAIDLFWFSVKFMFKKILITAYLDQVSRFLCFLLKGYRMLWRCRYSIH